MGGQGGFLAQAGGGAVSVVYLNRSDDPCCPTSTVSAGWGTVTSFDGGDSWTPNAYIYHSNNFSWCAMSQLDTSFRNFGFARAPNGTYYAAIADTLSSIRFFRSVDLGSHWSEFCGDTQQYTTGVCSVAAFLPDSGGAALFFPTVAATKSAVGVLYYETDQNDVQYTVRFRARSILGTVELPWQGPDQIEPALGFFDSVPTGGGPTCQGQRGLGDYQSMIASQSGDSSTCPATADFRPMWTGQVTITGGPLSQVKSQNLRVDPN